MRLFVLIITLLLAGPAMAWEYRNPDFGINVTVPNDLIACPRGRHEHNDGFLVFLDGKPGDCMEKSSRRAMAILANHNGIGHADVAAMRRFLCEAPYEQGGWSIGNQPALACRSDTADGWVIIEVIASSAAMIQMAEDEPPIPRVEYSGYLHTRKETADRDIQRFRRLLRKIRLSTPE